jgi:hypothetical protein
MLAMSRKPSVDFSDYWQRRKADSSLYRIVLAKRVCNGVHTKFLIWMRGVYIYGHEEEEEGQEG